MTLSCDIRIASEEARFLLPFTRLSISAELASTYLLPRLIGMGKALGVGPDLAHDRRSRSGRDRSREPCGTGRRTARRNRRAGRQHRRASTKGGADEQTGAAVGGSTPTSRASCGTRPWPRRPCVTRRMPAKPVPHSRRSGTRSSLVARRHHSGAGWPRNPGARKPSAPALLRRPHSRA